MLSNSIVVLAAVTLARPQSAVALWLPACHSARDNQGRQTRGDSNSLTLCCHPPFAWSVYICLPPLSVSRVDEVLVGVHQPGSLVRIYSCPYASSLLLSQIFHPLLVSFSNFFLQLLVLYPKAFTAPTPSLPSIPAQNLFIHLSVNYLSFWGALTCFCKMIFPKFQRFHFKKVQIHSSSGTPPQKKQNKNCSET